MKKILHIISAVAALLLAGTVAEAQTISVHGVVKDAANGEVVTGAAVQVEGGTQYSLTDAVGEFSINVPKDGTLIVSCLGFKEASIPVSGRSFIEISLAPDAQLLDETIVVAYGTASKSSFTGSAAVVKSDEIEARISTNVTSALAGTTPGVQIISSSGDPASNGSSIRIRGFGSVSASNAPLYVLDGMPYEGSISDINPQDVESISVLKDAAAAAIYGARGANGVVLITTKRATERDGVVKFDAKIGSNSRLIPQYDVISDPGQYYETFFKLLYNGHIYGGKTPDEAYATAVSQIYDENNGGLGYQIFTLPEGENLIGRNLRLNPNAKLGYSDGEYYYMPDNWYDEVFHNSLRQEYNVSVSGASDKLSYYASAGVLNDGGIINNSSYKRYTGRINADYQAKSWLKIVSSLSYSHSDSESAGYSDYGYGSSGNLFYIVNNIAPIYPLYVRKLDAEGNPYILTENGRTVYDANQTNFKRAAMTGNAVRDNELNRTSSYADVVSGKLGVILTPIKGLAITANLGLFNDNTRGNSLSSPFGSASSVDGAAYTSHGRYFTTNKQLLAEYKTSFGLHNVGVLAGYEQYDLMSQSLSGSNDHLFNPFNGELSNADGKKSINAKSSTTLYRTKGILSRVQYDYDGKYFLSASYRRDASSRFAPGHQWGNFGSVGGAWLISKEDFLSGVSAIDLLKLKASYGLQGNDNLGSYFPYADQYTHSYNEETGQYTSELSYKGNEELTWEKSKNFNIGVEVELWKGRLNGSLEFFNRATSDLLYSLQVPLSSGNPTGFMPVNVGSISNTGFELILDGNIVSTPTFRWDWNANVSHYTNTITSLDPSVAEEGIKYSNSIMLVGGSLYDAYMYKYAGVDPETGKALYYYNEKGEDGKVSLYHNENTKVTDNFHNATPFNLGTILPKLYGGFGTSIKAWGFDASVQFSYQLGGKYYDGTYQSMMLTQSSAGSAIHKDLLKAWTPENTDTDVPRLDGDYSVAQSPVDRFLVSSNYLSLNNLTLGYTLPSKLVNSIGVSGLRVYVAGENLAVLTARQGIDPRFSVGLGSYTSGSGLNSGSYSALRTVTAGVSVTF